MDEGALLVGRIERWAYTITVTLALAGTLLGGAAVGLGVVAGGLVGVLNVKWLHLFLRIVLAADRRVAKVLTHLGILLRYLALTAVLLVILKTGWVHPVGVLLGVSVVVVAVVVAGLLHSLRSPEPADQPG